MGKRSRFDEEFRSQAVALVRGSRRARSAIAAELGISDTTLANWMNRSKANEAADDEPLTLSERELLVRLQAEKRDWVIEREILKKRRPSG